MRILIFLCIFLSVVFPLSLNKARAKNNIDNKLIASIIQVESSGKPKAKSKKGALGLMQVRYCVWADELKEQGIIKKRNDLFHPQKNIKAGTYILAKYIAQTGDIRKALVKYSGGSKAYAKKVLRVYADQN
jgi:soluble lytic murein transglycosylase-like protein